MSIEKRTVVGGVLSELDETLPLDNIFDERSIDFLDDTTQRRYELGESVV